MILKGDKGEIELHILRRSNPDTEEFWDGNWLESKIIINISGFKINYTTNLRVDDLQRFYEGLIVFQNGKTTEVEFTTMEEGLYLHCHLEINGNVNCKGRASNDTGNIFDFKLQTELVSIDTFITDLKSILKQYPMVGNNH